MSGMWFSWTVMILILVGLLLYWPSIAGWIGEFRIGMALAGLPKQRYTLLHHVLISSEQGRLLRIDHLICGPAGYFVVESLSLGGRIRGESFDQQWISISTAGKRHFFSNPLRQNEQHVQALRHILGKVPIYNLVVFSRARLLKQRPDGTLTPSELVPHILDREENYAVFDPTCSMKNLCHEMITSRKARRRASPPCGLRRPLGHLTMAIATCVIAFSHVHGPNNKPQIIVRYKPIRTSVYPERKPKHTDLVPLPPHRFHFRHTYQHLRRHIHEPMQVIAMSDGIASILENGRVITLHDGQRSPHGWKLVQATPQYANMIGPHGHHFHFTP